ncbi:MAG: hypothetical protein ACI4EF_09680 [Coprococcus sp.]
MSLKQLKKILLIICLLTFATICTGCGQKVDNTIKVTSSNTANYKFSAGVDDEMMNAIATMSETSVSDIISQFKKEGYKYKKETKNGITYHVFSKSGKNAKFSKIEKELESMGYTNVCLKKDYFFATYDANTANGSEDIDINELINSVGAGSDYHFYQTFTIQLNGKVRNTNGRISKSNNRCVTWTYKNYKKSKNFYASTSSTKKTATVRNIKNGKTYKIGKNGKIIKISNASSAARITLNGKKIKNGSIIKKKGSYTLTIWSKSGKCRTTRFKIS